MALRKPKTVAFSPSTYSDATDGTEAPPGAMSLCQNLIFSTNTKSQLVPRPAAVSLTNFTGFATPGQVSTMLVVGTRVYGMIATGRNAGKDEPFCYDILAGAFITIGNVTAANVPTSPATIGDWSPPCMFMITNGRIVICHAGYDGVTNFLGWIDVSSFSSTSLTGTTHTSTLIDALSTNALQAGWEPGYLVSGAGVQANTYIVSIATNGLSLILSEPTTASAAGVALTVTGGTPAAPVYGAGNTNQNPLSGVPTCVAQFAGRAYYALGNYLIYSDSLRPLEITNASQALQIGDSTPITALSGSPLTSQVTGGIIQALIVFKGAENMYQVTGDQATSNLSLNAVYGSVGTLAPNTICNTPKGLAYIAPDGLRFLDETGRCSDPVGNYGAGVNDAFVNAENPSRMCADFNGNIIRITVQATDAPNQAFQEYWFHLTLGSWSGPHTFPASLINAYHGGTANTFIEAPVGLPGTLWISPVQPNASSLYTENSVPLTWVMQTALLPDNGEMCMNSVVETILGLALPLGLSMSVTALDEDGDTLGLVLISSTAAGATTWGSFTWGSYPWGTSVGPYRQQQLNWAKPLVFKQASLRFAGNSLAGLVIGMLFLKYQALGYVLQPVYST